MQVDKQTDLELSSQYADSRKWRQGNWETGSIHRGRQQIASKYHDLHIIRQQIDKWIYLAVEQKPCPMLCNCCRVVIYCQQKLRAKPVNWAEHTSVETVLDSIWRTSLYTCHYDIIDKVIQSSRDRAPTYQYSVE